MAAFCFSMTETSHSVNGQCSPLNGVQNQVVPCPVLRESGPTHQGVGLQATLPGHRHAPDPGASKGPWTETAASRSLHPVCNLYSVTKGQQAIRGTRQGDERPDGATCLRSPGSSLTTPAPIVRNHPDGRELTMARWGMPSPVFALQGKKSDPGVTNVRNTKSSHWRRWLGVENRCVVPFTSFAENEVLPDGSRPPIWFAPRRKPSARVLRRHMDAMDLGAEGEGR